MENNHFEKAAEQFSQLMEPANKLNTVVLNHLSKLAEFQLKTAKSYGEMTLNNLKGVADISDFDSLKQYANGQTQFAGDFSRRIMDDFKALAEMGNELKNDVEKVFNQDSAAEAAPETDTAE